MSNIKTEEILDVRKEYYKPNLAEKGYEFFKMPTRSAYRLVADPHIHDAIECIYVTNGSLRVYADGQEEHLDEGDFILFRSMGIHSAYTEECEENDYFVLKISTKTLYDYSPTDLAGRFALKFTSYDPKLKYVWRKNEISGTDIGYGIDRLIKEYTASSPLRDLSILISSLMILEGIYKGSFPEDDGTVHKSNLIFDSIVYINRNLDKKLTEEDIAGEFGVSYSHFSREFKKATGRTFKDYIVDTRMNHAEQLLVNTDLLVSEIAASCGYSNISYFISLYKKIKSKTPLKERKELEKRN